MIGAVLEVCRLIEFSLVGSSSLPRPAALRNATRNRGGVKGSHIRCKQSRPRCQQRHQVGTTGCGYEKFMMAWLQVDARLSTAPQRPPLPRSRPVGSSLDFLLQ